jgi:hypothetical protein
MIELLPPLGKYKYDTWRILPVKETSASISIVIAREEANIFYLSID